jgi:hypothetical protein
MYYSAYEAGFLKRRARALAQTPNAWCIFDNTARGAAVENGLDMVRMVAGEAR